MSAILKTKPLQGDSAAPSGEEVSANAKSVGGVLALTEPVWLDPDPPASVRACWAEYPAMEDVASARRRAQEHGYEIAGDFVLSDAAWWTHYYGPLEERLNAAVAHLGGDPTAAAVLAEIRDEIECRRAYPDFYGYLLLVLRT